MIKVYRIILKYKIIKAQRDYFDYVEYIRVKPDEEISDVIMSIKERMFYDFDNAPIIAGVTYSLHSEVEK